MKKINIKNLKIEINLTSLLSAIESQKCFDIDVDGKIYINKSIPKNKVIIFSSKEQKISDSIDIQTKAKNLFGSDYKPQIVGSICIITPLSSWMKVLDLNKQTMLYFDHQTDGVEYFEFPEIEDIGWNAVAFDITYRQLCTFIEKNCEGTFLFYDNEVHFNGFVVVDDLDKVKEILMKYICQFINEKIKNKEIDLSEIDDEQSEALEFFKVKD